MASIEPHRPSTPRDVSASSRPTAGGSSGIYGSGRLDHFETGGAARARRFPSASLRKDWMTDEAIEDTLRRLLPSCKESLKDFCLKTSPDVGLIGALKGFFDACERKDTRALESICVSWTSFTEAFVAAVSSKGSRGMRDLRAISAITREIKALTDWMRNYQRGPH
jgi:hypothetical protein